MSASKSLQEIVQLVGGTLIHGDSQLSVHQVMPADAAEAGSITFITKPKYLPHLSRSLATAVLVHPDVRQKDEFKPRQGMAVIEVASPYAAFAKVAQALADKVPGPALGIHSSAVVDEGVEIGEVLSVGPFVHIATGAKIGDGCILYPGVHVEANATIGAGSILYNHSVVRHGCILGEGCILHPGVVVGSDGFGFAPEVTSHGLTHLKIPQVGITILGDYVEVGSNSCIDRGALGNTEVGRGTKIDNLVQIAHNVKIGEACIVVAQAGIAGSAELDKHVILAAQAGVAGHIKVGEGATVFGRGGVLSNLEPRAKVMGLPAMPQKEYLRGMFRLRKLDQLFRRVKKLEQYLGKGTERDDT